MNEKDSTKSSVDSVLPVNASRGESFLHGGLRQSFRAQSCGQAIGKQGQMSARVSTQVIPPLPRSLADYSIAPARLTAFCFDIVARLQHVFGCRHLGNRQGWDCSELICVFAEFTCATVAAYRQVELNESPLDLFREAARPFLGESSLWSTRLTH